MEMSFSMYENRNGFFPIPSSYFSKCVLNSFFNKERQAVDLVSSYFFRQVLRVSLLSRSIIGKQGDQLRTFNVACSAVSRLRKSAM